MARHSKLILSVTKLVAGTIKYITARHVGRTRGERHGRCFPVLHIMIPENKIRDAIAVPLAVWCVCSLLSSLSKTKKLHHIPAVGHNNVLLSYWSALQYLYNPAGFLRKEWLKIPPGTKFVRIPELVKWMVVPVAPELYKEIANAPDSVMSVNEAIEDFLQAEHTLFVKEIDDHVQTTVIRSQLNRSLAEFIPLVHEDMVLAFEDSFPMLEKSEQWNSFVVAPEIMKIVTRMSSRVLVGVPLCRDPEFISANIQNAVAVFVEAYTLPLVPAFLRRFAHDLLSPIPRRLRAFTARVQPLIESHKDHKKVSGKDSESEPKTVLNWLVDAAQERNRADRDAVLRLMSLYFGVIHTTSITFTHALYSLLSRPELFEPLRAEIDHSIRDFGWSKEGVDNMKLLDSFLKESHRFDVMVTVLGRRVAAKDCNITGVFIPKGTTMGANMINAHFDQAAWGPTADEFNPYRFVNMEEETGRTLSLVTTTVNTLSFGYGRHACPGRFLAAQEQKLMLAYFLHCYDMKLDNKDGSRPKNMWVGTGSVPSQTAKILLRKRRHI